MAAWKNRVCLCKKPDNSISSWSFVLCWSIDDWTIISSLVVFGIFCDLLSNVCLCIAFIVVLFPYLWIHFCFYFFVELLASAIRTNLRLPYQKFSKFYFVLSRYVSSELSNLVKTKSSVAMIIIIFIGILIFISEIVAMMPKPSAILH